MNAYEIYKRMAEIELFRVEVGDKIRFTNRVGVVWEGTVIAVDRENCKVVFQNNIDGDIHEAPWDRFNERVEVLEPAVAVGSRVRCVPKSAGDAWQWHRVEGEIRGWVVGMEAGRLVVVEADGTEHTVDAEWTVINGMERVVRVRRCSLNGRVSYVADYQRSGGEVTPENIRKAVAVRLAEAGIRLEGQKEKKVS